MASSSELTRPKPRPRLRHLAIPRSQVTFTGVTLGSGAYGEVSEVEYDGKLCAGKKVHPFLLKLATPTEAAKVKDDFSRECHLWSTLRHPNVVLFLGVYYPSSDESGLPVMVMEKLQESVTSLVEKHDNIPLLVKLSILHDVSLGLRYLHGHNPPIVHRDLTPNNILVTPHLEAAKITDLGVAKAMMTGHSKTMTKIPGTGVFMPPEALDDKPVYGPPLDVFSFGGVILHITSRQWPAPKSWSQFDPKTEKRILLSEVERRQQYIDMMTGSDADLKRLVVSCLEDSPKLRPTAADLSERIKIMKQKYTKKTTHDGMDPLSWLAEIKLSSQLKQKVILKESTVPDLSSRSVNIQWKEGASAPVARAQHSTVVYNCSIFVGGGVNFGCNSNGTSQPVYTLDIYHPVTDTWSTIDSPHALFAMTVLLDQLVIVGGSTSSKTVTNKVLVLESGQWKDYTRMPTARCNATAVSHQSMMIVIAGYDGEDTLDTVELLDGTTGQWFKCDNLPQPLRSPQSVMVDDTVFVLAGANANNSSSKAVYATSVDTLPGHQLKWQHLVDAPCYGSAAVGLNDKYVLAVGGTKIREKMSTKEAFTLNFTTSSWTFVSAIPMEVMCASVACYCDNSGCKLVVIGGKMNQLGFTEKVWVGLIQWT